MDNDKGYFMDAGPSPTLPPFHKQPKAATTEEEAKPAKKKKAKAKTKAKKKRKAAGKSKTKVKEKSKPKFKVKGKAKAKVKRKIKTKPEDKAKPDAKSKSKAKEKKIPDFIAGLPGNPEVREVSLSEIDLDNTEFQLRASLRVGDLAANIMKHGQKIPVILKGQDPPFQIISGFRRVFGIQKIGWDKVSAFILPKIGEEEALKLSILENVFRKTYSDLDRALAIQRFREMGKTVKEIAEDVFHLKRRRIENLERLLSFDENLVNALKEEKIPTAHAILLQQAKNTHKDLNLKKWLGRIEKEQLSYHKLRKALRKEYSAKKGNGKPPELFREIKGKDGDISLRFRPVKLDPKAMTKEEAGRIKSMLERALELVKEITG